MNQTDLSDYLHDEKADRNVKCDPIRLAVGVLALAALALLFYFVATGANTNTLVAGGIFALLIGFVLL